MTRSKNYALGKWYVRFIVYGKPTPWAREQGNVITGWSLTRNGTRWDYTVDLYTRKKVYVWWIRKMV